MAVDIETGDMNSWNEGLPVQAQQKGSINVEDFTFWNEGLPFVDETGAAQRNASMFFILG